MIWGLLAYCILLAVDLITDVKRWYDSKPINHVRGAILRLIAVVPAAVIYWPSVFLIFPYWIGFDGFWNILVGESWWYIGTTAKLDILLRKYPVLVYIKYLLAAAGIILFSTIKP